MNYVDQYVRDNYTILTNKWLKWRVYIFCFYQYICLKNIIGKIFKIKFTTQKFKNYTIHFDNFYAFFAIFTELFIYNIYYFDTEKEKPFIVDCWANIWLAVLYFKYLYPESIIDCYEPDRETFVYLEKNIKSNNLLNVNSYNEAVSWEKGELDFYSFWDMKWWPWNTLEKSQVSFNNINSYKVKVNSLSDKKYKFIDFLKIDIEWSEWKVFQDLDKNDMFKNIERINLEFHYDEQLIHNKLSDLFKIIEKNNLHTIINTNILIWFYTTKADFNILEKKYPLIFDIFH